MINEYTIPVDRKPLNSAKYTDRSAKEVESLYSHNLPFNKNNVKLLFRGKKRLKTSMNVHHSNKCKNPELVRSHDNRTYIQNYGLRKTIKTSMNRKSDRSQINIREKPINDDEVLADMSSPTHRMAMKNTKCTTTKTNSEGNWLSNRIIDIVQWKNERDLQKLPRRMFSLDAVKRAHKKHLYIIKQKIKKLNAWDLFKENNNKINIPKTSCSNGRQLNKKFTRTNIKNNWGSVRQSSTAKHSMVNLSPTRPTTHSSRRFGSRILSKWKWRISSLNESERSRLWCPTTVIFQISSNTY